MSVEWGDVSDAEPPVGAHASTTAATAEPVVPSTAAMEPVRQPVTAASTTDTVTTSEAAPCRDVGRTSSASVKAQRKTCILKLDGCHYTIGT